jgi:4-nitrophenyl phosphatase
MEGIKHELEAEGIRSCGGEEDSGLFDNEPVPDDEEVLKKIGKFGNQWKS